MFTPFYSPEWSTCRLLMMHYSTFYLEQIRGRGRPIYLAVTSGQPFPPLSGPAFPLGVPGPLLPLLVPSGRGEVTPPPLSLSGPTLVTLRNLYTVQVRDLYWSYTGGAYDESSPSSGDFSHPHSLPTRPRTTPTNHSWRGVSPPSVS